MKQLLIHLPDELHLKFKIAAQIQGATMKDLVTTLIEQHLATLPKDDLETLDYAATNLARINSD